MTLEYGQIVFVPVPDGHGNVKPHPAVILSPNEEIAAGGKVRVVCVSTQIQDPCPAHHVRLPWHRPRHPRTGLNEPNVAKCDWLARIDPGDVIRVLGFAPAPQLARIETELQKLRAAPNG
jgi:mRNA-degrading endonuclease toxin of MazEF toxin-antitoxin module